jgi:outer membrane immunogenic protein
MKRLVLASVGSMVVMIASAHAADMGRAMPTKAVPYVSTYNWTGGYAGINGGYGFGRSADSFNINGGLVGGTVGYNWQGAGSPVVWGLEADLDWSSIKGSTACAPGVTCETRNNWLGTARGRIGYAFDRILPYVTGGLAVGNVKNSISGFGDSSTTKAGYALGGGVEAALAGPWTAKVEYLYADLGRSSAPLGTDARVKVNTVRAGLNYRF